MPLSTFNIKSTALSESTKITLGDFEIAGVGAEALTASATQLSQKTLIAVPYRGAELMVTVNDGYQACIYSGNNNNRINKSSGWLGVDGDNNTSYAYTLPDSSIYMRVSIKRSDSGIISKKDLALSGLTVTYKSTSDIIADNSDAVNILQNTDSPILIHISDIHGDVIRAERAAYFAEKVNADALLASGDLTANQPDDWGGALFDAIDNYSDVNFIYGIGNHDAQGISAHAYQKTIYDAYFKHNTSTPDGETYYYRDIPSQKLRIISVNQQEGATTTSSGGTCYSPEQVDWLVETLKSTPSGFGVILMYHSPETSIAKAKDTEYSEFFQDGNRYDNPTNSYSGYSGTFLIDLIDAFMMRKSFTWNYSERNGASPITLNADFTNVAEGVEFISHVTGHLHSDSITYLPGAICKQLLLGVTCTTAMYGADGGYYGLADYSDLKREANNANQDAFNAYIIDRESQTIRVLRIGARSTVHGDIRDDMTIPYSASFKTGDYPFSTEGMVKLDLNDIEWVNYGYKPYGPEPTYMTGVRYTTNAVFNVPYENVTFYVKINAPYEIGIRSGETDTSMNTNYYWLNNRGLSFGNSNQGYIYTIPSGHTKFILSIANVTRDNSNNIITSDTPMNYLELQAADLEIWYDPVAPENPKAPFDTDNKIEMNLDNVEWKNYGYQPYGPEPTYHVGTRLTANTIFDVPYEGVTLYIKINAPYELGIRSGETDTTMNTNHHWFNNKFLTSGDNNGGYYCTIPSGHKKFVITIGNVSRNSSNNVSNWYVPITPAELESIGLEIWYEPCKHVYNNGVCKNCGEKLQMPIIVTQPKSATVHVGEEFTFKVEAMGDGLTYQWYYRDVGVENFLPSCIQGDTYSFKMLPFRAGREYYCIVIDKNGNSVQTNVVKSSAILEITRQPENVQAEIGEDSSFSVKAVGEGLTYQWYYKNKNDSEFSPSCFTGAIYAVTMADYRNMRQVYCVITDMYGNTVTSDVATMNRPPIKLEIISQPSDVAADIGEIFSIDVLAKGEELSYQWYYKESYMSDFVISSNKTSSYSYEMTNYRDGRQVYCVVTDEFGNIVTTEVATIHLSAKQET